MTSSSEAWLLPIAEDTEVAVAGSEMFEYLLSPPSHPIPLAPNHCTRAMIWRNAVVPIMDLPMLLGLASRSGQFVGIAVVAYQTRAGMPLDYVGLPLEKPPVRIKVEDRQACDLPETDSDLWESIKLACACFTHDGRPVPVLNISYLCSESFRKLMVPIVSAPRLPQENTEQWIA